MIRLKPVFATILMLTALALNACKEEIAAPDPVALTRAAVGHYCNMIVIDHPGPKAQVFEDGITDPYWFTSVRDALFYKTLPGEGTRIIAVYVQDSAAIRNWSSPPSDGPWIAVDDALFVINSAMRGGMGARETVPFAKRADAETFRQQHGGEIVTLSEIPEDYLTGDDAALQQTSEAEHDHSTR